MPDYLIGFYLQLPLCTVFMWDLRSLSLLWSACHFLLNMIQEEVLNKFLIGIAFFLSFFSLAKLCRMLNKSSLCILISLVTEFYQDLEKLVLENIPIHQMLQSSIWCRVNKKLWLFNGCALHLPQQLMMPSLLLKGLFSLHWCTGNCFLHFWWRSAIIAFNTSPCFVCPSIPFRF